MSDVELDYDYLMQNALRKVVQDVLNIAAGLGTALGEHHFYVEFLTRAPGVSIPDYLLETYPERMTIVLQHQFESLDVTDDGFGVTLWFKGREARLEVPFAALVSFADPSVKFGLRFADDLDDNDNIDEADTPETDAAQNDSYAEAEETSPDEDELDTPESADVVSLDSFRKK